MELSKVKQRTSSLGTCQNCQPVFHSLGEFRSDPCPYRDTDESIANKAPALGGRNLSGRGSS